MVRDKYIREGTRIAWPSCLLGTAAENCAICGHVCGDGTDELGLYEGTITDPREPDKVTGEWKVEVLPDGKSPNDVTKVDIDIAIRIGQKGG